MMLENVGDVSVPVRSVGGVHIIKYVADVEPGDVPLEDVRESIESSVLATNKGKHYEEVVSQWVAEANAKINLDALK